MANALDWQCFYYSAVWWCRGLNSRIQQLQNERKSIFEKRMKKCGCKDCGIRKCLLWPHLHQLTLSHNSCNVLSMGASCCPTVLREGPNAPGGALFKCEVVGNKVVRFLERKVLSGLPALSCDSKMEPGIVGHMSVGGDGAGTCAELPSVHPVSTQPWATWDWAMMVFTFHVCRQP